MERVVVGRGVEPNATYHDVQLHVDLILRLVFGLVLRNHTDEGEPLDLELLLQ
jgi:hypothetical protein